ncbi:MAG: N-acetyltransferase [Accumulibacter sp.]|jgi:hypothetical protein|uniref:N-acyl amino acid synthase FeeM domain-containing protein n=1 Tax=Accumulibacter sp. TaxID=2053492 RepID=UPI002FC3151A
MTVRPMTIGAMSFPEKLLAPDGSNRCLVGAACRRVQPDRLSGTLVPGRAGYDTRLARTPHEHGMASMLVRRMYAWRGYDTESLGWQVDDPNRLTLAAWHNGEVMATLTLGRDSPAGLLADGLYASELSRLRCPDRVLCEVTRLAIDPDFRSPDLLFSLLQSAHSYGKQFFAASDVVIEVNPRHARYYQRLLGFRPFGSRRQCPRVNAPAVLLHRELHDFAIPADKIG